MTSSLPSQSFKSTRPLELPALVREVVAAMPIVIFANAIRVAILGGATKR